MIATWFPSVTQARQAVLDLLTGGIPRENIGVVIGGSYDVQAQAAGADDDNDAATESRTPDFVAGLINAGTLALPGIGQVIAAGPLADALAPIGTRATDGSLDSALISAGIPNDQARTYAEELRHGGALLAVRSDGAWDSIVRGVFRHSADQSLRAQEELAGPIPASELAASDAGGPISTSFGALAGGTAPGGWDEADAIFEDQDQDTTDDARRRERGA
jgi:hypothetical protein